MKLTSLAGALATVALLAGCGLTTHHTAAPAHTPAAHTGTPAHALAADPSLRWLTSPGGQAQVTFNQDVDTLASALVIENQATTVANHLVFEAAARTVRTEARTILAHPALLPADAPRRLRHHAERLHHRRGHAPARRPLRHHRPGLHRLVHRAPRLQHHRRLTRGSRASTTDPRSFGGVRLTGIARRERTS